MQTGSRGYSLKAKKSPSRSSDPPKNKKTNKKSPARPPKNKSIISDIHNNDILICQ